MAKLQTFTCRVFAPKASSTKVNGLRYDLVLAKQGKIESHQLPPCFDCLEKHAQRANYQVAIWRLCLEQNPGWPRMEYGKGQWTTTVGCIMDGGPASAWGSAWFVGMQLHKEVRHAKVHLGDIEVGLQTCADYKNVIIELVLRIRWQRRTRRRCRWHLTDY